MTRGTWRPAFLEALQQTGNVSGAAQLAGVARKTAYAAYHRSPAFAKQWDEAIDVATDALELVARQRAALGVEEPVYYQGQIVGHIRKYSDVLLIFLLKAHRPEKFRDNHKIDGRIDGTLDVNVNAAESVRQKILGMVTAAVNNDDNDEDENDITN